MNFKHFLFSVTILIVCLATICSAVSDPVLCRDRDHKAKCKKCCASLEGIKMKGHLETFYESQFSPETKVCECMLKTSLVQKLKNRLHHHKQH